MAGYAISYCKARVMIKLKKRDIILWGLIFIPYLLLIPAAFWYSHKVNSIKNSSFILINKEDMTLTLYNYKGELLQKSGVATGKNFGSKQSIGDFKTPEGVFTIASIEDATAWTHDFKDDSSGPIKGAYGPYFIRLNVPGQKGIGIHGTHDNNSIGNRASEGCIRMNNADLEKLVNKLNTASVVVITPGKEDVKVDYLDTAENKSVVPISKVVKKNPALTNPKKKDLIPHTKQSLKEMLRDNNKRKINSSSALKPQKKLSN